MAMCRKLNARMRDWALLDAAAAVRISECDEASASSATASAARRSASCPTRSASRAALMVGSQSGYWRNWPLLGRAWMWPVDAPRAARRGAAAWLLSRRRASASARTCHRRRAASGRAGAAIRAISSARSAWKALTRSSPLPIRAYAITDDALCAASRRRRRCWRLYPQCAMRNASRGAARRRREERSATSAFSASAFAIASGAKRPTGWRRQ